MNDFIDKVLDTICPERAVKAKLLSMLMDGLFERYSKTIYQVGFLLDVERTGTPMTLNHYFAENLEEWYVAPNLGRFANISVVARNE